MNPKFKDITAWEQAQLLMQPAFIRVLDNLRKQLENSLWKGTYTEIQDPYPIDTSLLDPTGELDWQSLETKTERIINRLFANLPQ